MSCRRIPTLLLACGAIALALFGATATAQDRPTGRVELHTAKHGFHTTNGVAINLAAYDGAMRFAWDAPTRVVPLDGTPARVGLTITAREGAPFDVAIAQAASLNVDARGRVDRRTKGSELRIGRNLADRRDAPTGRSVYAFVSFDDEALTWQPGARNDFGGQGRSLALQNQVRIGDRSAGLTFQRGRMQASFAYVEREASIRVGQHTFSQDQNFIGVTVAVRR